MTRSILVILGSCLALQAPLAVSDQGFKSYSSEGELKSLYFREHSKELLSSEVLHDELSEAEVTRFIFKRTQELLPAPFKGQSRRIAQALIENANKHQMDPLFLMAVIETESTFKPQARGRHGEIGLMQIKPSTAIFLLGRGKMNISHGRMEKTLLDPVANIRFGSAYLAQLRKSFKGKGHHYIAAYNMGSGKLRSMLKDGVQPRIYSSKVLARYAAFSGGVSVNAGRSIAAAKSPAQTLGL